MLAIYFTMFVFCFSGNPGNPEDGCRCWSWSYLCWWRAELCYCKQSNVISYNNYTSYELNNYISYELNNYTSYELNIIYFQTKVCADLRVMPEHSQVLTISMQVDEMAGFSQQENVQQDKLLR
jgi:hypothetical protein